MLRVLVFGVLVIACSGRAVRFVVWSAVPRLFYTPWCCHVQIGIGCAMIRRGCFSVFLVYLVCLVEFHFGSVGSFSVRCGGTGCFGLVRDCLAMACFGIWWFFLVRRLCFNSWRRHGR